MDRYRRWRWMLWMGAGTAAMTVATVAAVAAEAGVTAATEGVGSTAVWTPALGDIDGDPTLAQLAPSMRALDAMSISRTFYELRWARNRTTCPTSMYLGNSTAISEVSTAAAVRLPATYIRVESKVCHEGGLLAVTVDTIESDDVMGVLGERGVAKRLKDNEWAANRLQQSAVVGLQMHTWQCVETKPWDPQITAYVGDNFRGFLHKDGSVTRLPPKKVHMILATTHELRCVYSAEHNRPDDSSGGTIPDGDGGESVSVGQDGETDVTGSDGDEATSRKGGELPLGGIIGITIAAGVVGAAAAAATALVLTRRHRSGDAGDEKGSLDSQREGDDGGPSMTSPAELSQSGAGGVWARTQPEVKIAHSISPPGGKWVGGTAWAQEHGSNGGGYLDASMSPPPSMPDSLRTQS